MLRTSGAGMDEEDGLARKEDPTSLWLDDWAAGAPWENASHTDPVGLAHTLT